MRVRRVSEGRVWLVGEVIVMFFAVVVGVVDGEVSIMD